MQMQNMPMLVRQDLNLNVLRLPNKPLQKHRPIPERPLCLGLRLLQQRLQIRLLADHPHPSPTTAKRRLDDQRKTHLARNLKRLFPIRYRLICPLQNRHLQLPRHLSRSRLVTHPLQHFRFRPNKSNARLRARSRKLRILRQETISRMDRIHPLLFGQSNNPFNVKISSHRTLLFVQFISLIRFEPMRTKSILLRVNPNSPNPQLRRRPHDSNGNL